MHRYTEIKNSENSEIFSRHVNFKEYVLLEEVRNFWDFQVFDFHPYREIENSENSEVFSRLLNFKRFVLVEKVINFWGFQVFDFGPYNKIENSENSEVFPRLLKLGESILFEEIGIPEVSQFSIFTLMLKSKTQKIRKFSLTCKVKWIYLVGGTFKFLKFPSFQFWLLYWDRKLGKLGNIFKTLYETL